MAADWTVSEDDLYLVDRLRLSGLYCRQNIEVNGIPKPNPYQRLLNQVPDSSVGRTFVLIDALNWSSDMTLSDHQRQLWLYLGRFKRCSVVVLSRTEDLWLGSAIQSWIILEPIDLSNTIALATGILRSLEFSSKLATLEDQSHLEQLVTLSQGNPLAVRVIVYNLVKHFADDPSTTMLSHLISLLQLLPMFLGEERLTINGEARAVAEILEWIADDVNTVSSFHSVDAPHDGVLPLQDYPYIVSDDSFKPLNHSIQMLRQGHRTFNPIIKKPMTNRKLANCGFYSAAVFLGFWHNLPDNLEPFVVIFSILLTVRRYFNDEAFMRFRNHLCEFSE